jgi:hypothetical protein
VGADSRSQAGVQVTTKTPPIAFLLLLFKTKVTIDDETHVVSWGTNFYPIEPGHHSIEIGFRYFFGANVGRKKVEIDVKPGYVTHVTYHPPASMFAAGSILVD